MPEDKEVQVRLTAGVALEFAGVLSDAMEHLDMDVISQARKAQGEGASSEKLQEVGVQLITTLLKHSRESTFRFLATAAGMTVEELRDSPMSTITTIIRKIKEDPELKDFLEQARGMLG